MAKLERKDNGEDLLRQIARDLIDRYSDDRSGNHAWGAFIEGSKAVLREYSVEIDEGFAANIFNAELREAKINAINLEVLIEQEIRVICLQAGFARSARLSDCLVALGGNALMRAVACKRILSRPASR
jgi:hypothetical protein